MFWQLRDEDPPGKFHKAQNPQVAFAKPYIIVNGVQVVR